ncbi:MAG: IgGFc-binding protein [Ferruginibacter sp.]
MRKSILLLITVVAAINSYAQSFSNKGKDFWVGYGYHQIMNNGNGQQMVLYFATDQVTNITISIPGIGYTQNLVSGATPTVLTSNPIPKIGAQDARLVTASTAPEDKGIHITSDKPMVAYAHIYNQNVSGASILFPTNTLGKEYYSINYKNTSNTDNANCWFYVVATDPGTTTVEITPSADAIGHPANVPFTVNLTQGQIYNVMGELTSNSNPFTGSDLTGSKIKSIPSATGGCKRIAVYSGSGRISITCGNNSSSSDNYMVQAFPKDAWGKKYLTVPTSSLNNNVFRIGVADPATQVLLTAPQLLYP